MRHLLLMLTIITNIHATTTLVFSEPTSTGEERIHWYSTTDINYSVIVDVPNGGMSNVRFTFQGPDSPTLYMRVGPINTSVFETGYYSSYKANINLTLTLRDPNLRTLPKYYFEFTILEIQNTGQDMPPSVFAADAICKREYFGPETHIYIRHNSNIPIPIIPESSVFLSALLAPLLILIRRR